MPGMQKVLRGVLTYRKTVRKDLVEQFKRVKDKPEVMEIVDFKLLPSFYTLTSAKSRFLYLHGQSYDGHQIYTSTSWRYVYGEKQWQYDTPCGQLW